MLFTDCTKKPDPMHKHLSVPRPIEFKVAPSVSYWFPESSWYRQSSWIIEVIPFSWCRQTEQILGDQAFSSVRCPRQLQVWNNQIHHSSPTYQPAVAWYFDGWGHPQPYYALSHFVVQKLTVVQRCSFIFRIWSKPFRHQRWQKVIVLTRNREFFSSSMLVLKNINLTHVLFS